MKLLNPELQRLEQRIVPDISIGIGIGVGIGLDNCTTQCGCTSTGDGSHSTGPNCTS